MKIKTQEEFDAAMIDLKSRVAFAKESKLLGNVENMVDAINDANAISGAMAEYLRS